MIATRTPIFTLVLMFAAACAHTSAPWKTPTAVTDESPCVTAAEDARFPAEVRTVVAEELTKSGLAAESARLSATLTEVVPPERLEALRRASADGRCRRIHYRVDGLSVVGFVLEPAGAKQGTLPAILYARGGNADFGKIDILALALLMTLADAGFVVAATQYRGADGGDGRDEFGGDDVHDLEALYALVHTFPGHDRTRVYLYGHSRGSMEVFEALRDGLPVKAAAISGGLVDLSLALRERPEAEKFFAGIIPGWSTSRQEAIEHRSAMRWADRLGAPLLLINARQDWRAPIAQVEAMDAELTRLGKEHKLVVFDPDAHQLYLHRRELVDELVAWFRAHP